MKPDSKTSPPPEDFSQWPDPQLVGVVAEGNVDAFEALYRRHVGRVHGLCLRLCGGGNQAEDLTQECFVRAWQKIHSFRGDSAFSTWLYRLSANVVISDLRRRPEWLQGIGDVDVEPAAFAASPPLQRDLERAVARLPDGARAVLVLHDVEGYTHGEIAKLTGLAVGTSKAQLHRARNSLKGWLQ